MTSDPGSMHAAYRVRLERWIHALLYPGFVCLLTGIIAGTPRPSVWTDVLERAGLVLLSVTLGLAIAQSLAARLRP